MEIIKISQLSQQTKYILYIVICYSLHSLFKSSEPSSEFVQAAAALLKLRFVVDSGLLVRPVHLWRPISYWFAANNPCRKTHSVNPQVCPSICPENTLRFISFGGKQ